MAQKGNLCAPYAVCNQQVESLSCRAATERIRFLARLAPNVLSASGYSGHGVGTAVHAGRLLAEAVRGQAQGFDAMAALPVPPFPGGPAFRTPLLTLAMTWFALRDRIGL